MAAARDRTTRPRPRRRWFRNFFLAGTLLVVVALTFRQGWIPARYTPLPRLDLSYPVPFIMDWQLAELRFDRRLCKAVLSSSPKLTASPIADRPFQGGCGWRNAARITKVDGAEFSVRRVACPVAAALAMWVMHDVQPLARRILGQSVSKIQNFGTYSCRNIIGSKFWKNRRSEHASANAIDISGFQLADGTKISVAGDWAGGGKKTEFLRAVHVSACSYFRVTLGPDFNAAHKDHFHFDRGILFTCR
ncbi:MAG TPA: extensin family protein [Hyphomicrobiaceae bacterium]|nr:extensin family protein [Hyphomicrobiaceae bacterium]